MISVRVGRLWRAHFQGLTRLPSAPKLFVTPGSAVRWDARGLRGPCLERSGRVAAGGGSELGHLFNSRVFGGRSRNWTKGVPRLRSGAADVFCCCRWALLRNAKGPIRCDSPGEMRWPGCVKLAKELMWFYRPLNQNSGFPWERQLIRITCEKEKGKWEKLCFVEIFNDCICPCSMFCSWFTSKP